MMYFAQGIPYGLLSIAVPAWLASQGIGASEIASYLALVILPWALKLVTGPLMDRFQYLPMGRLRPWVLGAQLGLCLSLLALTTIDDPANQMGLLTLIGVLINIFAATQDVAVDGMSIELTPIDEQGRLNAFMSFGKAAGWASTAAVSGAMLVTVGLAVTAIAASCVTSLIFIAFLFVRERDGERMLPWSDGEARVARRSSESRSFRVVAANVKASLMSRSSLVVLTIMFFDGLVSGYGQALMPIAAVQVFGFSTPEWSGLVAVMGLSGAFVALLFGPMIDRFGARRMLILTVILVVIHAALIAETQQLWQNTLYVRTMLSIWVLLVPVVMVCVIALGMAVCPTTNAATVFAVFMSVANLGMSAGSKIYGLVSERSNYVESYLLLAAFALALVAILFFHRTSSKNVPDRRRGVQRFSTGLGSAEGGTFWSGAMRCPKCRSDMQAIDVDGVEVDRCTICQGLWFDRGEVERVIEARAAASLDIGDAAVGKVQNDIDQYRCPRCGGPMARLVDAGQPHIWFEKCGACHGSFFDAGELKDLSRLTIADHFRRFTAKPRV